ncbi:hypothetical protein DFH28DRAFT_931187 [Melampsora americana]|nr:hypothetical protein DFH28DRAFT_931187 [Melampsora americana]
MIKAIKQAEEAKKEKAMRELEQAEKRRLRAESRLPPNAEEPDLQDQVTIEKGREEEGEVEVMEEGKEKGLGVTNALPPEDSGNSEDESKGLDTGSGASPSDDDLAKEKKKVGKRKSKKRKLKSLSTKKVYTGP